MSKEERQRSIIQGCSSVYLEITHGALQDKIKSYQAYADAILKELKRRKRESKGKLNGPD